MVVQAFHQLTLKLPLSEGWVPGLAAFTVARLMYAQVQPDALTSGPPPFLTGSRRHTSRALSFLLRSADPADCPQN